jgi:CBS-domain-containing membrane protein
MTAALLASSPAATPCTAYWRRDKSASETKLAEVMTRDPDAMPPGKTAIEVLRLMEDGRYRHMPVIDAGKVVGIVSRYDFSGLELDRLDEETGLWERI